MSPRRPWESALNPPAPNTQPLVSLLGHVWIHDGILRYLLRIPCLSRTRSIPLVLLLFFFCAARALRPVGICRRGEPEPKTGGSPSASHLMRRPGPKHPAAPVESLAFLGGGNPFSPSADLLSFCAGVFLRVQLEELAGFGEEGGVLQGFLNHPAWRNSLQFARIGDV